MIMCKKYISRYKLLCNHDHKMVFYLMWGKTQDKYGAVIITSKMETPVKYKLSVIIPFSEAQKK